MSEFDRLSQEIGTANPVFYRTYSRRKEDGSRETWEDVCDRTGKGIAEIGKLTPKELELVDRMQRGMKTLTSGRWLWVGGTDWIQKPENFSGAYNCTSTDLTDLDAFGYVMELGMMGSGTGMVLLPEYINQLPKVCNRLSVKVVGEFGETPVALRREKTLVRRNNKCNAIVFVGDSRRGWVDSYMALIKLATDPAMDEQILVTINVSDVRTANEPLKGFGGVSNPVKLPDLYPRCADILNKAIGRQLTSVECCLLIDEAASVYVAGNVRRCLPEDARVHTEKGLVPIKDVQIGDRVHTPIGLRRVTDKFDQGVQDVAIIRVQLPNNFGYTKAMRATFNHRVAVLKDDSGAIQWRKVAELKASDILLMFFGTDQGSFGISASDNRVNIDHHLPVGLEGFAGLQSIQTYDLEVEEAHCFYADGFLTHNSAGMRQGSSHDQEFAVAKDNLWQQGEDGKWRIDPDRDALRMANHSRVFMHKPSLEECIEAVRKQFYSGEGAIQYAPEAIARSNADIIDTEEKRKAFLALKREEHLPFLKKLMVEKYGKSDAKELEHRIARFGLNPCLTGETMVKVWEDEAWVLKQIKELAESDREWEICDGNGDRVSVTFTQTDIVNGLIELTYERGDIIHLVRCTTYHKWVVGKGREFVPARSLRLGDRLCAAVTDENQEPWIVTGMRLLSLPDWEPVYCTKVPTTHSFDLEYLHTGNCGEIIGSNLHCNLSEIHLNRINPLNLEEQKKAFTAGAISAASLLHHEFVLDERYQYSRAIDPIVGVSFTGLFDFFVNLFGVDWLKWWEAGRPEDWRDSDSKWGVWIDGDQFISGESPIIVPRKIYRAISGNRSLGIVYSQIEQAYLNLWRETVEKTVWDYCDRHGLRRPNRCTTSQPAGCTSREFLRVFDNGLIYPDEVLNPGSGETTGLNLSVRGGVPVRTGIANQPLQLIKVTLANGRVLRMTPNHRLSISGEWIYVADMTPGMKIDFSLGEYRGKEEVSFLELDQLLYKREGGGTLVKVIKTPKAMCPDLAYFLGVLFGNGCLSPHRHRVRFSINSDTLLQKVQEIGYRLFGLNGCVIKDGSRTALELSFGSRQLYDWFYLNGLAKMEKSKNLDRIPLAIRCSSVESILSFFCGLIDTDGCIRADGSLSIDSASEKFLRNLQQVGEAVGLCFSLYHNTQGKNLQDEKDMWGLCLSRMLSSSEAVSYINRHSYKAQKRPIPPSKRVFKFDPYTIVSVDWEETPDYSYDFGVEGIDDDDSWYWQGGLKSHNTKSLLTGASPGVHAPKAQRYIRRITFSKDHPVARACMDLGFSVIPSQSDKDENGNLLDDPFDSRCTEWLVEIPVEVDWANLPGADKIDIGKFSALAQMDFYMNVQRCYARHNVSCTTELRSHEIEDLGTHIYNLIQEDQGYISVALLARFDDLQTYPRLPFEPIDKETYDRLTKEVESRRVTTDFHKALKKYDVQQEIEAGPAGCDSSACLMPEKSK